MAVTMPKWLYQRTEKGGILTVKNGCLEFCKTRFSVSVCATSSCNATQQKAISAIHLRQRVQSKVTRK